MTTLEKLASAAGRGDEAPNIALAREIAASNDAAAVRELVTALGTSDKAIASDCIKVLYEVGGIQPELIAEHVDAFVALLDSRNNRLVWGGMTAVGMIADQKAAALWQRIEVIMQATSNGSAITQDWGVRVLAAVSRQDAAYEARIFPFLSEFLGRCAPKDLPRHAESALSAVNEGNREKLLPVLEARKSGLKAAQAKRLEQVIRKIRAL